MKKRPKAEVYPRYPLSTVIIYNGSIILHYVLGGVGIILSFDSLAAYIAGVLYLVFAFGQMYIIMPLDVCRNCVYLKMENSLCVSGMNVIAQRFAKEGSTKNFPHRAEGLFCHNNAYIAALLAPIIVMIPALILNFSFPVLGILIALIILLLYRFFILFPREACIHCAAKGICPQAEAMGVRNK